MNVMVMDVEGTDGRERGEDQVRTYLNLFHWYLTSEIGFRTKISVVLPRFVRSPDR